MVKKEINKKGDADAIKSYELFIKILLAILIATGLYLMIKGVGNAFLPK